MMAVGMPPVQAVHQVGVPCPLPTAKRGKWLLTSRQIAPRMYLTRSTKATDRSQFSPRTASPAGALGVIFYPASKKAPTPHHTTPQHDQAVDLAWREEKWKFASQQITSARDIKKKRNDNDGHGRTRRKSPLRECFVLGEQKCRAPSFSRLAEM